MGLLVVDIPKRNLEPFVSALVDAGISVDLGFFDEDRDWSDGDLYCVREDVEAEFRITATEMDSTGKPSDSFQLATTMHIPIGENKFQELIETVVAIARQCEGRSPWNRTDVRRA